METDDFFGAFQPLQLPYKAADTSLSGIGDTTTISLAVLQQFIPDTALAIIQQKGKENTVYHPAGKIDTKNDSYILLLSKQGKRDYLTAFLFAKDKKKMLYKNHIDLLANDEKDSYVHTVDINSEPTFTITKSKTVDGQYVYSKNGYAYNAGAKSFIEVINESNEGAKNNDVINPIDTLAKIFRYSGDYTKDKQNFISVRDGNFPNRYAFFLHFEKNKGECTGELKGVLTMIDASKAVFQQSGDPCVIDFTFSNNSIKVKERGSCGNHRGITCQFDDSYKKKANPQPAKSGKKTK